ncbi:hypothetical protein [uncultured Sneathiella sp.]|uniref:hypothetical protein n=1 Tax=uncultured Sneathiella sp. TaxID=879315 RepID=UPI0025985B5C|nr:hypothetical protein [uncultured Sneathiella sp.]
MGKPRKAGVNQKGRNKHEQFVPLPYRMLDSDAWTSLRPASVKVWTELRRGFNGRNNGEILLPYAKAGKKLNMASATIKRALTELEEKGFIEMVKPGHWYGRKATEWRVTDQAYKGNIATNEWRQWKPGMSFLKTEVAFEAEYTNVLTVPFQMRKKKEYSA